MRSLVRASVWEKPSNTEKIEHRAVIKLLTKRGKTSKTILEETSYVYEDSYTAKTMVGFFI